MSSIELSRPTRAVEVTTRDRLVGGGSLPHTTRSQMVSKAHRTPFWLKWSLRPFSRPPQSQERSQTPSFMLFTNVIAKTK